MNSAKKYVLLEPSIYERQFQQNSETHSISARNPTEQSLTRLDGEMRSILESADPDDVKVKRYSVALKRFREFSGQTIEKHESQILDEIEILDSVPPNVRYKAKRLLQVIRDIPELTWNGRGELVYMQSAIPNSNIVALFNDILKQQKGTQMYRPAGWKEFANGLARAREITRELIPNYGSWKIIQQQGNGHNLTRANTSVASVHSKLAEEDEEDISISPKRLKRTLSLKGRFPPSKHPRTVRRKRNKLNRWELY